MMRLSDDGTLDTVIVCTDCGRELRYTYDPYSDDPDSGLEPYDSFVDWALQDAEAGHRCPQPGQPSDVALPDILDPDDSPF